MQLKSKLLSQIPGIEHGFGSRLEELPAQFQASWNEKKAIWKQTHGIACARIETSGQACGEVDALYSMQPEIPVAVMTADCVPILMARKDGGCVAAIHAGWRGTRSHILRELWKKFANEGEKPENWLAAIGPAIGPCCYEVSEELSQDFLAEFGPFAVPSYRHLDLPAINQAELHKIGIEKVELLRACTKCLLLDGEPRFHSFRREGSGTRQWSAIEIQRAPDS